MHAYRVVSIEKTEDIPHVDTRQGKWYRYLITNGINDISECRCGKLSEVREYLDGVVHRIIRQSNLKPSRKRHRQTFYNPCFARESGVPAG